MDDEQPTTQDGATPEPEVQTPDQARPSGSKGKPASRSDVLLPAPGVGIRRDLFSRPDKATRPAGADDTTVALNTQDLPARAGSGDPARPTSGGSTPPGSGAAAAGAATGATATGATAAGGKPAATAGRAGRAPAADPHQPAAAKPAPDSTGRDDSAPDSASLDSASLDSASRDSASLDRASLDSASLDRASLDRASRDKAGRGKAVRGKASRDNASRDDASLDEPGGDEAGEDGPGGGEPAPDSAAAEDGPVGGLRRPRWWSMSRAALLIGVLCGLLGFGLAVQVKSNTASNGLAAARQEDLVRILDDLSSREERLRRQISSLEAARSRLTTTGDKNSAALVEARSRSAALGVLAGTVAAQGPGIQLTMTDPQRRLKAEDLLDAVEELRAAGAEAIQVGPVRIGLDSAFTDSDGSGADSGILTDNQQLTTPYVILAIGDPATLATALNIPGGVVDTVRQAGGQAAIDQQPRLVIRALRSLSTPHYAQPAE